MTTPPLASFSKSKGYGLAFLMVFLISSTLIGSSFHLMSGTTELNYLDNSQNNQSAYNVALYGLEQMQTAIQTQLNANTAVTTSFTSSGTLTMPTDADQLIAGNTTVGTYTASVTNARGSAYTVSVTGTAGNASTTITRLLLMSRTVPVLDLFTPTYAYSLRRLRSAYTGSAIRIRNPETDAETDIGFTPSGDLDIAAVLSAVGYTQQPPVDQVSGAVAAYGLRKLLSAYAGSAIRVRRSSDDTEQDIGFDNDGNLDLDALFNFVSTGSGYVKTWYDQSGNGYDASQATTTKQPMIVNSGVLVKLYNGKPALKFDGSDDRLTMTRMVQDDFSILASYSLITPTMYSSPCPDTRYWWCYSGLIDADKGGAADDFGMSIALDGSVYGGSGGGASGSDLSTSVSPLSLAGSKGDLAIHWTMFTRVKSSGTLTIYLDDSPGSTTRSHAGTPVTNNAGVSLSASANMSIGKGAAQYFNGYITEVLIYNSALSSANRLALQKNQGGYFHMEEMPLAYVKTWYDQSGNANNLTQTTKANQPTLVLQTGQRPTIAFNGASTQLQATNGLTSGNGARTLNVVMAPKFTIDASYSGTGWLSIGYGNVAGSDQYFGISYTDSGLYTPYTAGASGNSLTSQTLNNDNSIVTVVRDGASTTVGYLNGNQVTTQTGAISTTASGLNVGKRTDDRYNDGRVSEIIGFNSNLSTANRTTLEEDQKSYYAIQQ